MRTLALTTVLAALAVLPAAAAAAPLPAGPSDPGPVAGAPPGGGPVICGPPRLAYGTAPAAAAISAAGEIDCHRFEAAAGDRVRVRVTGTSGSLAARAEGCGATAPAAELTCVVPAAGIQAIHVRDANGTGTGAYAISLQRLNDPAGCAPLAYGTAAGTGAIAAGETECRRFTGAAGDRARVRLVTAAAGLDPRVEVLRPDGTTRCGPAAPYGTPCTLDAAGTHTILIRGAGAGTGGYSVGVQRLGAPVGCLPIAYGTGSIPGTLATTGEADCWRVEGTAGARARVRLVVTGGAAQPRAEVLRPDGVTDCQPIAAAELTCELEATGTQTIVVADAAPGTRTGTYRIAAQRLDAPVGCGGRTYGTHVTHDTLTGTGETACWRFAGGGNHRVRIRATALTAALTPTIEVLRPDGTTRCNAATVTYVCELDQGGMHTLLVRDWNGTATGAYGLAVQRLNWPAGCTPLEYGAGTDGATLETAQTACWQWLPRGPQLATYTGDVVRVRVVVPGGALDPMVEIVRPDGTTRCGPSRADAIDCRVDASGDWSIHVRDHGGTTAGDYRIGIQRLNDPVGCSAYPGAGWVSAGDVDCRTFNGQPGDKVRFHVVRKDGSWLPVAEVLRPEGHAVCGPTSAARFTCTLDRAGAHTLLVHDGNGAGHGGYGAEWQRLNRNPPCDLRLSGIDERAYIGEAGEIECFRLEPGFLGPLQTLATRVRAVTGTLDPVVEVLHRGGSPACGPIPAEEWRGCDPGYGDQSLLYLVYDAAGTGLGDFQLHSQD